MGDLVSLHTEQPEGSLLCTVELFRNPNGVVGSRLVYMDAALIETTGEDVSSRMLSIARWLQQGALDMERQSRMFDLPLQNEPGTS